MTSSSTFRFTSLKTAISTNLSPLGRTSLFMAAGRAVESDKAIDIRLFHDPYARSFASKSNQIGFRYLKELSKNKESKMRAILCYIKHRTYFIDGCIKTAMNFNGDEERKQPKTSDIPETEICNEQRNVIFMGVGCDSRPYRLQCLSQNANAIIYELDVIDILEYRQQILIQECSAKSLAKIIPLVVDFREKNEWMNILLRNGFDCNLPSIFIMEGLLCYLRLSEISNMFENILQLIDVNSHQHWIIGNCLNVNTIFQGRMNGFKKKKGNITIKSGFKEPHLILNKYGFKYHEIVPCGSFKGIKEYSAYLEAIQNMDGEQQHIKADHFAKSFLFCASNNKIQAQLNSMIIK